MAERKIDPRTFSLIMFTYDTIAKEMAISVERSSWGSLLSLIRDFSVCIIDSDFNLIAVPDEILPGQAVSLQRFVKNMAAFFEGEIYDGDVLLSNMPYIGNLHIGEIAVASPVFYQGELMFWTAARGHMMDMGAPVPASTHPYTRDIYSEGLKIPPVKVYEKGKLRKDVLEFYLSNLRYRTTLHGDLMAHIAGTWVGKDRLIKFVDQWGPETMRIYTQELLDYADRMTAAEIRKMKPGTYYGEDWADTNSYGTKNIPIRAKLTVEDDMWIVDLSENVPQMIGGINCTLEGITEAVIGSTLGYCINPRIPKNEGVWRHYKIICPKGNIFNAQHPFATQVGVNISADILYRALLRAAAGACPEMVVAGSTTLRGAWFSGIEYREGRNAPWGFCEINEEGGGGAGYGADGSPCMLDMEVVGGTRIMGAEMIEWLYPVLLEKNEIVTDTHGPGKWRGAPGVQWILKPYESSRVEIYTITGGNENPPYGVAGGKPGVGGVTYRFDSRRPEKRIFHGAQCGFFLEPGWCYAGIASGGGGYGDPLERDPELVSIDVKDEIVSVASAKEDYGVIVDPKTCEIDYKATEELRDRIRKERGAPPLVSPTEPGAGILRSRVMTESDEYVDLDHSPDEGESCLQNIKYEKGEDSGLRDRY